MISTVAEHANTSAASIPLAAERLLRTQPSVSNALSRLETALGHRLMVRGTPAIFFADGSRVGGAIPKEEIEKRLKQAM